MREISNLFKQRDEIEKTSTSTRATDELRLLHYGNSYTIDMESELTIFA